ncbi:MAG: fibronectin type III-like domain-contianing protein [Chloroflexota bacterium]|nr:fibronectin type III-like domain-contianing protein [Chloroflexota bacterium]
MAPAQVVTPLHHTKSRPSPRKGISRCPLSRQLRLDRRSLAYWDDARRAWVAEAGEFEALVGSSSQDIRCCATFRLTHTSTYGGPEKHRTLLSVDTSLRELLADNDARAVIERHLPGFAERPQLGMAMGFTLTQMSALAPDQFPDEALRAIARDLEVLRGEVPAGHGGED